MRLNQPTNIPVTRPASRGFSIVELLVVVVIMAVLLGAILPVAFSLDNSARIAAAINTVDAAAQAARAYATRLQADNLKIAAAAYSGSAMVFTPQGEIRLTTNHQTAVDGDNALLEGLGFNGYRDMADRDYILMPRGTSVVGVYQEGGRSSFYFTARKHVIQPPFAVHFNQRGQLAYGNGAKSTEFQVPVDFYVVYDGDGDGVYRHGWARPVSNPRYDPGSYDSINDWSSSASRTNANRWNDSLNKWILPFERLESVPVVLVYSTGDFEDDGGKWPSTAPARGCGTNGDSACSHIAEWFLTMDPETFRLRNATPLYFSPYSGAVIKE